AGGRALPRRAVIPFRLAVGVGHRPAAHATLRQPVHERVDPGLGLPNEMAPAGAEVAVTLPTLEALNLLPEIVIHDARRHPIGPVILRRRNACVVFLAGLKAATLADDRLTVLDRLHLRHRAAEERSAVVERVREDAADDALRPPFFPRRRDALGGEGDGDPLVPVAARAHLENADDDGGLGRVDDALGVIAFPLVPEAELPLSLGAGGILAHSP